MKGGIGRGLLLAIAVMPGAWGQFQLYLVNGSLEQPVAPLYDLGPIEPGLSASVPFRIRNIGNTTSALDLLSVGGSGFTLTGGPALPATLAPQQSVNFTVVFQSAGIGSYSASLDSVGISVLLTATVPAELTCLLSTAGATQPLGAATVNFGVVQQGSAVTQHVVLLNQTNVPLTVPALATAGAGFTLSGSTPSGILLQPVQSAGFDVQFSPATAGPANGSLLVGSRSYLLSGTGSPPSLPAPQLSVGLVQALSAQQGTVTVNLSQASATSGSGTVTLAFQPAVADATDPAIAFATGGQTAGFTVSAGDTQGQFGAQASVAFQTGSTAGSLVITVQLGSQTDQQTIVILPAAVGETAAQGTRGAGTIELDVAGFDNTRTAGTVTFTFFDSNGNTLAPGAISTDSTAAFAGFFQNSAGGTFLLKAVFPITGDATQIAAFEADLSNATGTTKGVKTNF
ncbi:MAG: choice-of-anchor D domain-containing protein [Bryobacteraceae bacterium]